MAAGFPAPIVLPRPPAEALARGIRLSTMQGSDLSPVDVARVLNAGKVRWMLIGAHAINIFTGRPRATQDVDVVTDAPVKARALLARAFPDLEIEDHAVMIRFKRRGEEALNVVKASSDRLFRRVMRRERLNAAFARRRVVLIPVYPERVYDPSYGGMVSAPNGTTGSSASAHVGC